MTRNPISLEDLQVLVRKELVACSDDRRAFFAGVAFDPVKWQQSPWGHVSGGFWALATFHDRVLWYNDIEEGFNVSRFGTVGVIPDDEYWCHQDALCVALAEL